MSGERGEDGRPNGRMSLKSSFERSFFADIANGDSDYAGSDRVESLNSDEKARGRSCMTGREKMDRGRTSNVLLDDGSMVSRSVVLPGGAAAVAMHGA